MKAEHWRGVAEFAPWWVLSPAERTDGFCCLSSALWKEPVAFLPLQYIRLRAPFSWAQQAKPCWTPSGGTKQAAPFRNSANFLVKRIFLIKVTSTVTALVKKKNKNLPKNAKKELCDFFFF